MTIGRESRARGAAAGAALGLAMVGAVALAGPAGATIDSTSKGMQCQGSAAITPKGGQPYTIVATQSKAHVPRRAGPVQYSGSTSPVSHHHHGEVKVKVGPVGVNVYSWASPNDGNKPSDAGTAKYPSAMKSAPPGIYRVTGFHTAAEGGCSGHMDITIDGSPLSSPAGAGAAVATVVSGVLMLAAGLAKKGRL